MSPLSTGSIIVSKSPIFLHVQLTCRLKKYLKTKSIKIQFRSPKANDSRRWTVPDCRSTPYEVSVFLIDEGVCEFSIEFFCFVVLFDADVLNVPASSAFACLLGPHCIRGQL